MHSNVVFFVFNPARGSVSLCYILQNFINVDNYFYKYFLLFFLSPLKLRLTEYLSETCQCFHTDEVRSTNILVESSCPTIICFGGEGDFIFFLLLFEYSCLHFSPTTPTHSSHPHLLPLILPHFGFVHGSFIHVP